MNAENTVGCFTIVENSKGKILLVKRKDYPVWDLPGGRMEKHEQPETCAMREMEEETGYRISIMCKIGEYDRPQYHDMQYIYSGKLLGGEPIKQGPETAKIGWFRKDRLPFLMVPHRRKQIKNFTKHHNKLVKETLKTSYLIRFITKFKN